MSIKDFLYRNQCALPDHLKDKKHDDWLPGLRWIPRAWNVKGPRCWVESSGYKAWPPKLIEGKGVVRWETEFAESRVYIPILSHAYVNRDIYGTRFRAYEEDTGEEKWVTIEDKTLTWREIEEGKRTYSPSAVQKYSLEGWMKLDCGYKARWNMLVQKEFVGKRHPDNEDFVFFYRRGWRPDHLDVYYNKGFYVGLHWE